MGQIDQMCDSKRKDKDDSKIWNSAVGKRWALRYRGLWEEQEDNTKSGDVE